MKLRTFLKHATKAEQAQLATVCSDSVPYLYQLAGRHRYASPQLAMRIEQMSRQLAARAAHRLGLVPRESLVRYPEIFSGILIES